MITLDKINLQRGSKILLEEASATINPGQNVALIGANGCGKSSLFQLILSQLSADGGDVLMPANVTIAHMAQEVAASKQPAIEYVIDGDQRLRQLEGQILEAQAADQHSKLADLHQQLDDIDGYNARVRAEQLLMGLGFSVADQAKAANAFSGGWRIRLNLAQALMCPSDILLLDEPTNHLDLDAELWLEQWLKTYTGSLILISHDRDFIDNTCQHILQIEHKTLNSYTGNYSDFERQRAARLALQQANYQKQQQRIKEIQSFVTRFKAKASKAKQAQSRVKELERMELIAPAHVDSPFSFYFPEPEKFSDPLLNLSHAAIGYGDTVIASEINLSIHPGTRLGLLGANGMGKSTLIKTLAGELPLVAGERTQGEHLHIGYFSQHQLESLDLDASCLLHLQRLTPNATEQQMRTFLGSFAFHGDMALESIRYFSGGEKARLALAIIVWQKPNLLLLDEPTNHLDLEMCHALTIALQDFNGAVIVVSHDRHLLRNSVDQFVLVNNGQVDNYDDTLDSYSQLLLSKNKQAAPTDSNDSNKPNKKEQRQQNAEQRKQLAPLRKALKQAENKLQKIDAALTEIEQALADNSIYDDDNREKLQDLLSKQGELSKEKEHYEEQWLELTEQLENAE